MNNLGLTKDEMYADMVRIALSRRNMFTYARLDDEKFTVSECGGEILLNGVDDCEFYEGNEFSIREVKKMYNTFMAEYGGTSEHMRKDIDVIAGIILDYGEKMVNGLRHVTFMFAGNHIDICQTKDGRLEACEMDPSDFSYSHGDIHTYAPFEVSGFRDILEDKYTKYILT